MGRNQRNFKDDKRRQQHKANKPTRRSENKELSKEIPDHNDELWYAISKEVLQDVASFPFSKPIGSSFDIPTGNRRYDGIATVVYRDAYGPSGDNTALNKAMFSFYSFMRQANSGARNYEAPDLGVYLMAAKEIPALLAECRRAYGAVKYFSAFNTTYGRELLKAMGYDWDNLTANLADFRAKYNILVSQFNANIRIPNDYKIYARKAFLASNLFADDDGTRAQLIIPIREGYGEFDGTFPTGSALIFRRLTVGSVGVWDYVLNIVETLMRKLVENEDIQIMSGDILRAYGDSACMKLSPLDMDYSTPILVNAEFSQQFHNLHAIGKVSYVQNAFDDSALGEEYVLYQNGGSLYSTLIAVSEGNTNIPESSVDLILDMQDGHTAPGDVMEATRLQSTVGISSNSKYQENYYPNPSMYAGFPYDLICGSEVVTAIYISKGYDAAPAVSTTTIAKSAIGDSIVPTLSSWNHAPLMYITSNNHIVDFIGEIRNCIQLHREDLLALHAAAVLGLFDVPVLKVSSK